MRLLVILCFAVLGNQAWAQEIPATATPSMQPAPEVTKKDKLPENVMGLRQLAGRYYYESNSEQFVRVMEKLHFLRPNNGEYMYQLVIAYALNNQATKAYNLMLIMQQQGLAYDFTATEDVANIRDTEVFEYISDLMVRAGEPMGTGTVLFSLPQDFVLPEAIDWDPNRERYVIGNVVEGRIVLVDLEGNVTPFIKSDPVNGPWGVYDIKIDPDRKLLWVSSAAGSTYSQVQANTIGKSGLFKFDLETGKLLGSYLVADTDKVRSAIANMALAPDGAVYVADSLRPVIYKLEPGADALVPAFAAADLISIRGLALSEDGKMLYLADYELGLLVLLPGSKQAGLLAIPENFNSGGIDGLYLWNNHLVAVQNGNDPQRIMRLELDQTGAQVLSVRPLEVAHPEFDSPNYGVVIGDDLHYFANSQWHRISSDGTLRDGKPVSIMKTSLLGGADLMPPEVEKIMEQIRNAASASGAKKD